MSRDLIPKGGRIHVWRLFENQVKVEKKCCHRKVVFQDSERQEITSVLKIAEELTVSSIN